MPAMSPPQTAQKTSPSPASSQGTAIDLFDARVRESAGEVALKSKVDGVWRQTSWREFDRAASQIAAGLIDLGVAVGDRVVILSDSREEWVFCDVGILKAGAVTTPIYASNLPDQCQYIISDSGAVVCIVENPHQLEKLLHSSVRGKLSKVKKVVVMSDVAHLEKPDTRGRKLVKFADVLPEGHADRGWVVSLAELRNRGQGLLEKEPNRVADASAQVTADSISTIVYTSGTTGDPKGVVLTHGNLVFESLTMRGTMNLSLADEQVLFLPLCHIFAKMLLWASIAVGARITFAESVAKLIDNLGEVKPTFMGAVPRVYEKAYAKIQGRFAEKRKSPVGKLLIDWALKMGKERSEAERRGKTNHSLGVKLADKLVFAKIRDIFGGRVKFFVSGGAPLSGEIAEFFHAAGILILEGYGLTETTAATHCNRPQNYRFGTVGTPLPGVETRIADDGEILVRGPNIMREYYGKPEATREAIDSDGWFHTGDIGVIEASGHLRITDRKKDLIITAGGKNVAPQNIENAFKALCPLASQMMVYGDKKQYLSALITLGPDALAAWAKEHNVSGDYAALSQREDVRAVVEGYVKKLNEGLASYETIKKFTILDRDFDMDSGELTPTLKVKRKFCNEKYRAQLEAMYQ